MKPYQTKEAEENLNNILREDGVGYGCVNRPKDQVDVIELEKVREIRQKDADK